MLTLPGNKVVSTIPNWRNRERPNSDAPRRRPNADGSLPRGAQQGLAVRTAVSHRLHTDRRLRAFGLTGMRPAARPGATQVISGSCIHAGISRWPCHTHPTSIHLNDTADSPPGRRRRLRRRTPAANGCPPKPPSGRPIAPSTGAASIPAQPSGAAIRRSHVTWNAGPVQAR